MIVPKPWQVSGVFFLFCFVLFVCLWFVCFVLFCCCCFCFVFVFFCLFQLVCGRDTATDSTCWFVESSPVAHLYPPVFTWIPAAPESLIISTGVGLTEWDTRVIAPSVSGLISPAGAKVAGKTREAIVGPANKCQLSGWMALNLFSPSLSLSLSLSLSGPFLSVACLWSSVSLSLSGHHLSVVLSLSLKSTSLSL